MFLQILPPDNTLATSSVFDSQLAFVLLGLAIGVFIILRITKYLSKVKLTKASSKPKYTSEELDFS